MILNYSCPPRTFVFGGISKLKITVLLVRSFNHAFNAIRDTRANRQLRKRIFFHQTVERNEIIRTVCAKVANRITHKMRMTDAQRKSRILRQSILYGVFQMFQFNFRI